MTTRQPQTAQEAAMLRLPFLAPNLPRGLFGGSRRRGLSGTAGMSPIEPGTPTASVAADTSMMDPPPIDQAPPPPADWKATLGADLAARVASIDPYASRGIGAGSGVNGQMATVLPPSPPMRGGPLGASIPRGLSGGLPMMSDKIANRGAPVPADANGHDKKGFDWRMVAGIVGDALLGLNDQPGVYGPAMWKMRQQREEHNQRLAEQQQEWQYRLSQPDYATVGNRRFAFNPATGEANTLYVAPSEAQDYAAALGATPGTPEYETLMADYVLRHSGPTATANAMLEEDNRQTNRVGLEGVRQQNRIGIEGVRQGNRMSLRQTPTYRDTHARPSTGRSGGSKGAPGGVREGQTATNPHTGAKVVYRGGKWVPIK